MSPLLQHFSVGCFQALSLWLLHLFENWEAGRWKWWREAQSLGGLTQRLTLDPPTLRHRYLLLLWITWNAKYTGEIQGGLAGKANAVRFPISVFYVSPRLTLAIYLQCCTFGVWWFIFGIWYLLLVAYSIYCYLFGYMGDDKYKVTMGNVLPVLSLYNIGVARCSLITTEYRRPRREIISRSLSVNFFTGQGHLY